MFSYYSSEEDPAQTNIKNANPTKIQPKEDPPDIINAPAMISPMTIDHPRMNAKTSAKLIMILPKIITTKAMPIIITTSVPISSI